MKNMNAQVQHILDNTIFIHKYLHPLGMIPSSLCFVRKLIGDVIHSCIVMLTVKPMKVSADLYRNLQKIKKNKI